MGNRSHRTRRALALLVIVFGLAVAACTPDEVAQWLGVNLVTHNNAWLACVRGIESHGTYDDNTGNGYFGAYQYLPRTWNTAVANVDGPADPNGLEDGRPDLHSPHDQDRITLAYAQHSDGSPWAADLGKCGRP